MAIGDNVLCGCKRKEMRKSKKKIKKARRVAYHVRRKVEDVITEEKGHVEVQKNDVGKPAQAKKKRVKRRKKKTAEQQQKEKLLQGIEEDDLEIHRYERILGYNKRKSKNMPAVFHAEGLDYLLEMCDNPNALRQSDDDEEVDPERDSDEEMFSNDEEEERSENGSTDDAPGPSTSKKAFPATEIRENDGSQKDEESEDEKMDDANLEEDIYGRLVNTKTGEIVPSSVGAREKLDELEQKAGLLETEEHLKLKKCLRGLVNRLNEHTLVGAVKRFAEIFASSGHNEVKQLLFLEIMNNITVGYRLPCRLIIEYALFIALIHTTVSSEVSSYFVENYVVKLLDAIAAPPEGKSLENQCILLAELYNFKVIKVIIIVEIMQRLREQLNDKCLTCFKAILSYCGNVMRSRNLDALQKCITETQSFLSQLPEASYKMQQLRYTVDEIGAIKNANVRKFTDTVDSTLHDHYVNIFRGLTRKVDKEKELPMSVDDIVHIPERGRWWLVGSAWLPVVPDTQGKIVGDKSVEISAKFDSSLLQLAKKAKMNTTIRRDIFCTLMSSTDEMDAFEKLLKLSLKGQQEREIIHISIHCALREAIYNAFYAAVIDRLCCYHKRFKLTTQYALWDRIRDLAQLDKSQRANLAQLIVDLLVKRSVGITLLKIIEFGAIDKMTAQFMRRILAAVLTRSTQQALMDMFQNVVTSSQHKLFAEGLQIFIHMALKKPQKNIDNKLLLSRIEFLDSIWGDDRLRD